MKYGYKLNKARWLLLRNTGKNSERAALLMLLILSGVIIFALKNQIGVRNAAKHTKSSDTQLRPIKGHNTNSATSVCDSVRMPVPYWIYNEAQR